jgi:hypothetical protein
VDRFFLSIPKRTLEIVAIVASVLILAVAGWFWFEQILAARALLDSAGG